MPPSTAVLRDVSRVVERVSPAGYLGKMAVAKQVFRGN